MPGTFTPTEVIELAGVAGRLGGIHESHQRDDAAKVLERIGETIAVTSDQYPYTASSTSIASALLPAWALELL